MKNIMIATLIFAVLIAVRLHPFRSLPGDDEMPGNGTAAKLSAL